MTNETIFGIPVVEVEGKFPQPKDIVFGEFTNEVAVRVVSLQLKPLMDDVVITKQMLDDISITLDADALINRPMSTNPGSCEWVDDDEDNDADEHGQHSDGSVTLCPEVMHVIKQAMLRRGCHGIKLPEQKPFIEELADAIYKHQGISFEQWT